MNRQKTLKTKSCEQPSPPFTGKGTKELRELKQLKQSSPNIIRVAERVSQTTTQNKHHPRILEQFLRLVNEGNLAKLSAYFANYGIDPEFVKFNLDCLIEAEFQDLSA